MMVLIFPSYNINGINGGNMAKVDCKFKEFFIDSLKIANEYNSKEEVDGVADDALSTMEYDIDNGDSLSEAFSKACRDLHIDPDGIESYI